MPKYRVYLQTVASTVVEVEADSPDEAMDASYEQDMPRLCAHCSGGFGGPSLDLGEWEISDDEPVEEVKD